MIALSPPLPGWLEDEAEHVLLLAMDASKAICLNEIGNLIVRPVTGIQVDIRYEHRGDRWLLMATGLDVPNGEEAPDDGSEDVSFDLPDVDDDSDGGAGR